MKIKRLTLCGLLTALALTIFVLEAHIPALLPIPGIKLGLSNVITLFALWYLTPKETWFILLSRILLGSFLIGNPSILLYSLIGGIGCLLIELLLIAKAPIWAVSGVGAMVHNLMQLGVAAILTQTLTVFYYLPYLLISGILTGLFTGLCIYVLDRYSGKVIRRHLQEQSCFAARRRRRS